MIIENLCTAKERSCNVYGRKGLPLFQGLHIEGKDGQLCHRCCCVGMVTCIKSHLLSI